MAVDVKICGITSEEAMAAAYESGASFIGMVFYPPSPRSVTVERAQELLSLLPPELEPEELARVGLFVDPEDSLLDSVMNYVRLDILQLHGKETPERVEALRQEYGLPVMKSLSIGSAEDLARVDEWLDVADWLLFDAKPPKGATLPGGNAASFDWSLLQGKSWPLPWMLAGGLNVGNLEQAVRQSGARIVDVSSGVEDAPGVKSPEKIKAFLDLALSL
ncbi:phosphoribosylanthranilate isomerase [Telmatospirillum sp. J64-1]|uniref:phosphoribosylanthranilate isomerase n=1 Tax=Telmatospirillum sp. J64-1 TaxID=2502183 RepID=UPI00115E3258|nr:phosphoribosylanthranilate isomerase [Telmatospirillum sp. J64-1]